MSLTLHMQPFLCFLFVFVLKVPLKIFVKYHEKKQKLRNQNNPKKIDYEQEKLKIQNEINKLNPMEDFVKVSKLQRKIISLNKKLYQ